MSNYIAKSYGWASRDIRHSHSYLLPTILQILDQHKVNSLLDIGTGNGATIPSWLSKGIKVSAMEPDSEGFDFAKQQVNADVRKLGVGDILPQAWINSFDAAVSLEVVEHLFEPGLLVKTIRDVLKKDGIGIISTPYHGYFKNIVLSVLGKWDFHHHPLRTGGHIKFWSKKTLTSLFVNEGFEVLTFKGVGRVPFLWKSMIVVFKRNSL